MITGRPIAVRGAMVTASSVAYPDTGETAWADATVYAAGDTRSYLITDMYHKFECKLAHTSDIATGKIPEAYPDDTENLYWIDLGAVNKYAPFHLERNTQNDATSPYTVSVNPGERVKEIAIGNILADTVKVEVFDSAASLLYTETKTMIGRDITSWYDWLYAPTRQTTKTLFSDLPPVPTHTFKLTFTRSAGNVKVGAIIPSVSFDIGDALYSAKVDRDNFSTITRSFDGEAILTPRRNVPKNQITLLQKKSKVDGIKNLVDDLNAKVTFFAGLVETTDGYFESLLTIGIYKSYSYSIDYPEHAIAQIETQEI